MTMTTTLIMTTVTATAGKSALDIVRFYLSRASARRMETLPFAVRSALAEPLFHEHAIRVVRGIGAERRAAPKSRGFE
jgi:hypothetical protein